MTIRRLMNEYRLRRLRRAYSTLSPASLEWLETFAEFLAGNIHVSQFRTRPPDTPESPSEADPPLVS